MGNQVTRVRPLEDAELLTAYKFAFEIAEKNLAREEIAAYSSIESYLFQLSEFTIEALEARYSDNDAASTAYNKKLLQELYDTKNDGFGDPASGTANGAECLQDQFTASQVVLESVVEQYTMRALGPCKISVLNNFLIERMLAGIFEWGSIVKKIFRTNEATLSMDIATAQQQLRSAEAKVRVAHEIIVQQKEAHERAMLLINERITSERSTFQEEIQSKQAEIDRTRLQVERLSSLHKEAFDRLDLQIQEEKEERSRLEADFRDAEARRESERQEAQRQLLESERNFHNEEKGLLQGQQKFLQNVLELERQLGEQDTNQIAELYRIDKENQEEISNLSLQHGDEQEELKEGAIRVRPPLVLHYYT
ncbi:unnamed protein product [Phytophthora fragariaefolia]|uniref:Unnamed protein product n=1 Tax=Phytophthora fragariaefolia TaxID=1490495 RepID=A0A9W7CPR4_9STRA|nr:unnamed protein product [Phytophthora fragariaefolia]